MNKRLMTTLVVAVLALGLSGLAQDKPAAPEKPAKAQARPMERMKDALGITPEQQAKLEAHRKAVGEQQKAFAEQMKKVREEMQALRKDGAKPDPAKQEALIDKMFKLRADQAKTQLRNRIERDKIFTPEQLEKMKTRAGRLMGPGMMMGRQGLAGGPGMMRGRLQGLRQGMRGRMMQNRTVLRNRIRNLRNRIQARRWIWDE